jgi:hypothetical protein
MPPLLGERRNDMAIRYVKDFEFPSAAGFTKSATPVTGQMYAKGGEAKAPKGKGVMLIIGVGSPKGPMKKAEGGYSDMKEYMSELEQKSPIQSGSYGKKKPEAKKKAPPKSYIPGTNVEASDIMDADERARLERGYKMGGKIKYEDDGKDTSVPVKDVKSGKVKQSKDADYYREMEQMKKPAFKKGGAMKHEDEAMDRKLVKQMIKPAALKKMGGGMAQEVQMAKSNAISKSLKGQKQTPMAKGGMKRKFADGGTVMAPQGSLAVNPALQGVSDNRRQNMLARDLRKNPVNDMLTTPTTGGPTPPPDQIRQFGGYMAPPGRGPITQPSPMGGGRGGAPGGGMTNFGQGPGNDTVKKLGNYIRPVLYADQGGLGAGASGTSLPPNQIRRQERDAARDMREFERDKMQMLRRQGDGGPGGGRPGVVPAGAGPYRPGVTPFPPTSAGYKSGGKVKSPLQSMGMSPRGMSLKQAKGVPASSRAPMIAPLAMGMNMGQAAPKMGSAGVGVNEGRPGKPNVGAIRAAMAKAATAANPDASPAMMKRGGKASMSKC